MKTNNPYSIIASDQIVFYCEKSLEKVRNLVEESYGPYGKNILLDTKNKIDPELFKNGSKIIKNLQTKNKLDNLFFLLFEDAFQKVSHVSGDGTKTFFLIASYLISNGFKNIIQQVSSLEMKIGMSKTICYALNILNDKTVSVNTKNLWKKIITRYIPEEDNLREIFQQAFESTGKQGQIKINSQTGKKSNLTIEQGMHLNRGYFSPYFVTDSEKMISSFVNPYVLITNQKITMEDDYFIKLLEPIIYEKRSLLIISPEITEQALSTLILNKVNGIFDICYVKFPLSFLYDKNILEDLALYTNTKVISSSRDWKLIKSADLGQAEKIIVTKTKTIVWAKKSFENPLIKQKCQELKEQMLYSDSDYENEKRENRRKNFIGSNATIEIGGMTNLENSDLYLRVQTGLLGAKSCLYEGVLTNSAINFAQLMEELENWSKANLHGNKANGSKLVINALFRPLQIILSQQNNRTNFYSKNAFNNYKLERKKLDNFNEVGNLDSFKSLRIGLQTAASLTYSILSMANIVLS